MESSFSVSSALHSGWKTANANRSLLLKVVLTIGALQLASGIFNVKHVATSMDVVAVLVSVIMSILAAMCTVGLLSISLKLAKGEKASYGDIIPVWHTLWRFALVSIVTGVFTMIGFVLLIIPGVYILLRLSFAKLVIIDKKDLRIFDALHESSILTHGVKWELLGLFLVIVFINILGVIPLGLGLLVTIPVSMLAVAHVYIDLARKMMPTVPPAPKV